MTKEQEEAIKKLEYYLQNSVYKKIDSDSFENNWEVVNLEIPQAIETVLNILKQNSAEIAEKSAEIEKKDKIIDLMAYSLADYVMYYEYSKCRNPVIIKDKAEELKEYYERKAEND